MDISIFMAASQHIGFENRKPWSHRFSFKSSSQQNPFELNMAGTLAAAMGCNAVCGALEA